MGSLLEKNDLKDVALPRANELAKLDKSEDVNHLAVRYVKSERDRRRTLLRKQRDLEEFGDIENYTMDKWEVHYLKDRAMNG